MKTTLMVNGMSCDHCKRSVTDALSGLEGVTDVEVDLEQKKVVVEHADGEPTLARLGEKIEEIGFEVG